MKTTIDAMKQTLEAIAREEAQTVEPVAWIYEADTPVGYFVEVSKTRLAGNYLDPKCWEESPLFTHPAPPSAKQPLPAEREALIAELNEFVETLECSGAVRTIGMAKRAAEMLDADAQRQAGDEISIKCYRAQIDDLTATQKDTWFADLKFVQRVLESHSPREDLDAALEATRRARKSVHALMLAADARPNLNLDREAQQVEVPQGWKLVPISMTDSMRRNAWLADHRVLTKDGFNHEMLEEAYRALLEYAPQPPQGDKP